MKELHSLEDFKCESLERSIDKLVKLFYSCRFKKQEQPENEHLIEKENEETIYPGYHKKYQNLNKYISIDFHDFSKLKMVELTGCNLSSIPHSFRSLHLVHLNLSNNKLPEIPSCIVSGLKTLEVLDLGCNKIKYFPTPESVLNLKSLRLNDNNFETIPHWFLTFVCATLEEFDYSHNKANHYEYWKYSYLDKIHIKRLSLRNSCLIDKDLVLLKRFRSLECLDIGNEVTHEPRVLKHINKFKDLDMLFVRPLWRNLSVLDVKNLSLVTFPPGIMWLESLRELNISFNYISWIEDIQYLVNLEILDISNNQLVALPKNIECLPYVKIIRAQHNMIEAITALPKSVCFLDLYDNIIDSVCCDLDWINCDIECNIIKINNSQYVKQRDIFRSKFDENDRQNVCIIKPECYDSSSSKSSDISEYDESSITSISDTLNENIWEMNDAPNIVEPNFYRIYIFDEEWMFEDTE